MPGMPHSPCRFFFTNQPIGSHPSEVEHVRLGKTFLVSVSTLLDDDGRLAGVVHTAKDITEQRRMETRLRQDRRLKAIATLAGGVAHEFNNALTMEKA